MSYYVIDVIMTLRDVVVGWLVRRFHKKGAVRLGLFLLGPPATASLLLVPDVGQTAIMTANSKFIFSQSRMCYANRSGFTINKYRYTTKTRSTYTHHASRQKYTGKIA